MFPRLLCFLALLFIAYGTQAAEITWDAENGYQSDEVELSGLLPEEIRKILNWMNTGRSAEEAGRFSAALRSYKKVYKRFPKSQYAPEAYFRTGKIRRQQNKIDQAFDAYWMIALIYPNYGSFNATVGELYKIAVERMESYRVKIFGVLPGFLNLDRALKYFDHVIFIAPYSDYAPLALMNNAQIYAKQKNDTLAIYSLDRLITNYPNSFLTPDAYLQLAETHRDLVRGPYYDQANTDDAITYYEDFLIQFPDNNRVGEAEDGLADSKDVRAMSKLKIADYYYKKIKKYEAAKIIYNEAITIAPLSKSAEIARKKLDEIATILNEKGEIVDPNEKTQPTKDDLERRAEKRAKKKVLGIF